MTAIGPHPFRTALEYRDLEGLSAAMHPDVTFATPALDVPLQGRERAIGVYVALAGIIDDYEITDELVGVASVAIAFRIDFDGHRIEGVDHLHLGEDGRVRAIVVSMRPLESLQALAAQMIPKLDELMAGQ
jgi:SnoaL-like protein